MKQILEQLSNRRFIGDPWPEFCEASIRIGVSIGLNFKDIAVYLIQHKKEIIK